MQYSLMWTRRLSLLFASSVLLGGLFYGLSFTYVRIQSWQQPASMQYALIIGNSNRNFSGGTSITLQLLPEQSKHISLAVLGNAFIPPHIPTLSFGQFLQLTQKPLSNHKPRVFYTRRNDEMIQGLIAKKLFGAKIKIVFSSAAQRHHTWFTRWLMRQMDSIVSTSPQAASFLPSPPDAIIPHGINTQRYFPPKNKQAAWKDLGYGGQIGMAAFGRVRHSKGIDVLVEAAIQTLPKHPQAVLLICGETQNKDAHFQQTLQHAIDQAGLQQRIRFIGTQDFDALPKIFQGISIVAAMSREEGYGLTPLEGMASGAAALTSAQGVWPTLIRGGKDGFVVPTANVEATAKAMVQLLKHPNTTKKMGLNAAKYIQKHHSIQQEVATILAHVRWVQDHR